MKTVSSRFKKKNPEKNWDTFRKERDVEPICQCEKDLHTATVFCTSCFFRAGCDGHAGSGQCKRMITCDGDACLPLTEEEDYNSLCFTCAKDDDEWVFGTCNGMTFFYCSDCARYSRSMVGVDVVSNYDFEKHESDEEDEEEEEEEEEKEDEKEEKEDEKEDKKRRREDEGDITATATNKKYN